MQPNPPDSRRSAATTRRAGFTLLELMAVMAIVVILLSLTLPHFTGWSRQAAMRGSLDTTRAALDASRQWAISHGQTVSVTFGNAGDPGRGYFVAHSPDGRIGNTNYLAQGVAWTNGIAPLAFHADGSCGPQGAQWVRDRRELVLHESGRGARGMATTIEVFRVTGLTRTIEP